VSNTKKVLIRYRGDGRAITREVEEFDKPSLDVAKQAAFFGVDFATMEKRVAAFGGRLTENMVVQSAARQYGKAAALGMMYGMTPKGFRAMSYNYQQSHMFSRNGGMGARDPKNGPFRIEPYKGSTRKREKYSHKVVNKNGYRVHRGGMQSCRSKRDLLNTEYAKWLMIKPDEPDQTMFGGNSAVNWKAP
jgi:hypothetical protein